MLQNYVDDLPRALSPTGEVVVPLIRSQVAVNEFRAFFPIALADSDCFVVVADINSDSVFSYEFDFYSELSLLSARVFYFVANSGLGNGDTIVYTDAGYSNAVIVPRFVSTDRWHYTVKGKCVLPYVRPDSGQSLYCGVFFDSNGAPSVNSLNMAVTLRVHTKDLHSFNPLK